MSPYATGPGKLCRTSNINILSRLDDAVNSQKHPNTMVYKPVVRGMNSWFRLNSVSARPSLRPAIETGLPLPVVQFNQSNPYI